jgi:hypothetical protein
MLKRFVLSAFWIMTILAYYLFFNARLDEIFAASIPPTKQVPVAPPPMGWSSWNSFSNTIDSTIVVQQTKAMVASGMKNAGYQYVNIDEGWWLGRRDANGNIIVDAKQWPALRLGERAGDMSNIVRYIHAAGLKAGIYTDAGESGCSFYGPDLGPAMPHTGSEGHYDEDFLQFAKWGFDYVKVDWCGGDHENLDPAVQYAAIASAIRRAEKTTGNRLYYSICNWGSKSPWTWAPGVGGVEADIWRTSGDIVAPIVANTANGTRKATFKGVLDNFDQGMHPAAQHTGFHNDPDMMMIGMPGLSDEQNRIHMSLWAISGAPLIVGADLSNLNQAALAYLTNPDVIAVDQDPLGLQSIKIAEPQPGVQIWARPLAAAGSHAVLLLNRNPPSTGPATIRLNWEAIGLDPSIPATVKDLWSSKNLGPFSFAYTATIPAGDAVFLVVRGANAKATRYDVGSSVNELTGGTEKAPCEMCRGRRSAAIVGEKPLTFKIPPIKGAAFIQVEYINRSDKPLIAQLQVDGQLPTNVLFPPTGSLAGEVGAITVEIESERIDSQSTLRFSSVCPTGLYLASISVLPPLTSTSSR